MELETLKHLYIDRQEIPAINKDMVISRLNKGRVSDEKDFTGVTYYFEVDHDGPLLEGLANAAQMILEHGTVKPWALEGSSKFSKPDDYDKNMSVVKNIKLLSHDKKSKTESGLIEILYPSHFFSKRSDSAFPLAQFMMAIASEPFSAFVFYRNAKIVKIEFSKNMLSKFQSHQWSNRTIRKYLGLSEETPIIGTIVKPKSGLTPEIFADSVVQAAEAGAKFTKADENMHLSLGEVKPYVSAVVEKLNYFGYDLHWKQTKGKKKFIFAPHISSDVSSIFQYAEAAVSAGANALMFSPYYSGGFEIMRNVSERFEVPVYAHTAGMNVLTGSSGWGIDSSIMYQMANLYGAAFMQLTAFNSYLKPNNIEKKYIINRLRELNMLNDSNMSLVIAGGIGPDNIGKNMKLAGGIANFFLAGTSVYMHPDGPASGVKALLQAYEAYNLFNVYEMDDLVEYAEKNRYKDASLARALERK